MKLRAARKRLRLTAEAIHARAAPLYAARGHGSGADFIATMRPAERRIMSACRGRMRRSTAIDIKKTRYLRTSPTVVRVRYMDTYGTTSQARLGILAAFAAAGVDVSRGRYVCVIENQGHDTYAWIPNGLGRYRSGRMR